MRWATAALALATACSKPPDRPPPTPAPKPAAKPAPIDRGRQFAAAWTEMFEESARQLCACADDGCRRTYWTLAMVWMRDAFDDPYELGIELDPCYEARLRRARGAIEACGSRGGADPEAARLPVADCPPAAAPETVEVEPWWEAADPCPAGAELEVLKLPPPYPPRVFRAGCKSDGVDTGRLTHFHLNGSVRIDGTFRGDKRHGAWRRYYLHGLLASEEQWVDGELQGPVERVYRDGSPKTRGTYHRGARWGAWTEWPPGEGQPRVTYYENGNQITRDQWEAGGEDRLCMLGCGQVPPEVSYHVTARRNLESARARAGAGDWEAAISYYRFLISRFPYSSMRKDAEADLRAAAAELGARETSCGDRCGECRDRCKLAASGKCAAACKERYAVP